MIQKVVFSKPNASEIERLFERPYEKIRFSLEQTKGSHDSQKGPTYFAEFFTSTQVFHAHFSQKELEDFILEHAGKSFKNCVKFTETEEISVMASRKGKISTVTKKICQADKISSKAQKIDLTKNSLNLTKNYIIPEGKAVPFLVELGVMTKEGKVVAQKYDKFRQINRFLEFVRDILPDITHDDGSPIRIIDFGCGKSYLTFAVHYYLNQILGLKTEIVGLDLKKDVIEKCSSFAKKAGYDDLKFFCGSVENYFASNNESVDLVITLHACDTATDYALASAVKNGSRAILSVPCCQHELNLELKTNKDSKDVKDIQNKKNGVATLLQYGIVRERICALATDVMRCELLKSKGYSVQLLEFIDMEGTPKNLLIRGVKRNGNVLYSEYEKVKDLFGAEITLAGLLNQ